MPLTANYPEPLPQSGPLLDGYKQCTAPFLCKIPKPDYCSNTDFKVAKGADTAGKALTAAGAVANFIPHPAAKVAGRVAAGVGGALSLGSNVYLARNYPDVSRTSSIAASMTAGALIDRAGAGPVTSIVGGQVADTALGAAGLSDPCD